MKYIFFLALAAVYFIAFTQPNHHSKVFFGFCVDPYPITYGLIEDVQKETQILPALVQFYRAWPKPDEPVKFPKESLDVIWDLGAIPCLSWEPWNNDNNEESTILISDIVKGKYDTYIREFAQEAKRWKNPFMIRLAQEMNLARYHWAVDADEYNSRSPEKYVQMFRHVVKIFKQEGAQNVFFVFCPNVVSEPRTSWNKVENYYPGNEYVDIFGMDGYNWSTNTSERSPTFQELFSPLYTELKHINPRLPIFVFETAAVGNKDLWLREAFKVAHQWGLQGILWFQVNKEHDWRILTEDAKRMQGYSTAPFSANNWIQKLYEKRIKVSAKEML